MRNLTLEGIQSMFAANTGHVWTTAATIAPPDGVPGEVLRFVANNEPVDYGEATYQPLSMEVQFAADNEDSVPQAKLRLCNVGRETIPLVRLTPASDHPQAFLEVFRIPPSGAVVRELGPTRYDMLSVGVDVANVDTVLGINVDFLNEPAIVHRFTPNLCPGLFP